LYYDLLRRSVSPGDRVLDPFAGSGPILPAAQELKCRATALEIDPAAFGIGVKRLEKLKDQKDLEGL
jgi:DNA modification methylase